MRSLKYVQLHINQGFTYIKPSWIKVDLRLWLKKILFVYTCCIFGA